MRSHCFIYVFASSVLLSGVAMAAESVGNRPFDLSTPMSFRVEAAQVHAGLSPGGEYGFVSTQDRARIEQEIAVMDALFQHYGNIEAMGGAQRIELYNAQESVNYILTRGRTGTTRCAWAQQTGSHVPRTLCWSMHD